MNQLHLPGFLPVPPVPPPAVIARGPFAAQMALASFPDVPGEVRSSFAKQIGRAGEELVGSLLTRFGFENFATFEDKPYDRLVRYTPDGGQTTKEAGLQVKTATVPRNQQYSFSMQCGYRGSPQGRRPYDDGDYDIAALVVLPMNAVYFTAEKAQSHQIHLSEVLYHMRAPQRSLFAALGLPFTSALDPDDGAAVADLV